MESNRSQGGNEGGVTYTSKPEKQVHHSVGLRREREREREKKIYRVIHQL